jgi:hypothetical protein
LVRCAPVIANARQIADPLTSFLTSRSPRSTFLPQDRVAAFAMMTASERLRETQKAAGHRNLNTWHDVLIKEGKTCKAAQVVRLGGRSPHKTKVVCAEV